MNEREKYIYGIINSNAALELFTTLDSKHLTGFTPNGSCETERVYTIPYQDISAVVSDSVAADCVHLRKDVLARLLVKHQKTIEKIMDSGFGIVPVKLGTIASNEVEVGDILEKGYGLIKDIMGKISDKIEIDLVATWSDFSSILKEVGQEKEVKEFKDKLLANPVEVTVDDQMRVGVMVKKALDKKRERYAQKMQNHLKAITQDFKTHEPMDDKMVANFAFLINKAKHKDFEKMVEELNNEWLEKLNFRCVGPLPAYSFYTLEVKKWQFQEIDWARKKLRLMNDFATKDEIKKAYKALAFSSHPDKNPNTPGIEREFDEITKAYGVLWEYCLTEACSFSEEEFKKNAIMVKVKE
ncbi:GvpL/GvpF family gas vesicle protein [Patescibacteria group bacterium]|nr:GvpL/GvpF family gas vesicle protein [Patescibacteria group bacterium]